MNRTISRCIVAFVVALTTSLLHAQQEPKALWHDDFKPFKLVGSIEHTLPVGDWSSVRAVQARVDMRGRLNLADASGKGWSKLVARRRYARDYRWLQVNYVDNELTDGYQFLDLHVSTPGSRQNQSILTIRPGLYTFDTWTVDTMKAGKAERVDVTLSVHGSGKLEDGTIRPGSEHRFGYIRLVQRPLDGLTVTMADGSPLKRKLTLGETIRFEMHLARPAHDVTVDMLHHFRYQPDVINGKPYVQLKKVEGDPRHWQAEVTLGKGTTLFVKPEKRVFFRAIVADGDIWKSWYGTSLAIVKK